MATEAELYARAMAKFGDPDKAAAFVATYLDGKGVKPAAKAAEPAKKVIDHAKPPAGGPKNKATAKPAVAPPAPQKVEPVVAPVATPPGAYMPSPASARMSDTANLNDAKAYGEWAADRRETVKAQLARSGPPNVRTTAPHQSTPAQLQASDYMDRPVYGPVEAPKPDPTTVDGARASLVSGGATDAEVDAALAKYGPAGLVKLATMQQAKKAATR